jgi:hypothetical protein
MLQTIEEHSKRCPIQKTGIESDNFQKVWIISHDTYLGSAG